MVQKTLLAQGYVPSKPVLEKTYPPYDGHQVGKFFDLHMGHLHASRRYHDFQKYAPRRHSDHFYAFRVAGKEDLHTQLHSNNFPPTIVTIVSWLADIGKG